MLDRFKFRMWSKDYEWMVNNEELHEASKIGVDLINKDLEKRIPKPIKMPYGLILNFDDKDAIFMQSTGLKDRNGKLIFEGDILDGVGFKYFMVVVFDEEEGGFAGESIKTSVCYGIGKSMESGIEIIGNIYENPELLKGD